MKTTQYMAIAAAFACVLSLPVQAGGDPKAGYEKNSMCAGCHGLPGWKTAFPSTYKVPKLGGQHEEYLVAALKQYKSGERNHPSMKAVSATLSDADIANLAAYYASSYSGPKK